MQQLNVPLSVKLLNAALLVSLMTSACSKPPKAATARPAVPVKLQKVQYGTIEVASDYVGHLEATKRATLKSEIEGRITQIADVKGKRVKEGEPLVKLRPDKTYPQLQAAQAQVKANEAALNTAKAQLLSAQADRTNAMTNVRLQEVQYQRTFALVKEGAQAKQQLDIQIQQRDSALGTLRAADEKVKAAAASVEQANSNLAQAKAQVAVSNVDLQYKQVNAPITGIAGDFSVKVGEYVRTGDTLTTITRNDVLSLNISVNSSKLSLGVPVKLFDATGSKQIATGQISFISPQVDSQTQTVLTKAHFLNTDGSLRDGQFVHAKIVWSSKQGLVIPTEAVTKIGSENFVYTIQKANSSAAGEPQQLVARKKAVKLGDPQGQNYPVVAGVEPNDRIVVSGILSLNDGTPIQPQS
ncbi:MAG: efflux RND transporter periplasmic adaptor subunit [Stigonema ocellatum SAG 48.90 = DSM 106950]|nr:efflux RND transporter periplasmic adaptor subunit [Stigonema ocellatum SAG 48.90 = DSM 106950]